MTSKYIYTDGTKGLNLLNSDDPSAWTFFSGAPVRDNDIYYARVSAVFRAFQLKANTVGNMPFTLMRGKREHDNSATWENKVGFMSNPSELFRLDTLSYMATNAVYNTLTSDALGYRPRGLYNHVPYYFNPYLNPATTELEYIERTVGSHIERYAPDGKQIAGDTPTTRLIYMWRHDHTSEVLPSPATEAAAIGNAAGVIYNADAWIKHFFERGGVVPMIIAMKGMVSNDKKETEAAAWSKWYQGLGPRMGSAFRSIFRVTNAEALDVKPVGSGIGELKDNVTYQQALANIAMGTGMPLSLLMANSANYATAKEEKATWYENDIIPLCNWLAYEYNRAIFEPMGLRLEFHPETLDPQQEDETERATAINTFMDFLAKCPTFDIFIGTAETFGYELSDKLVEAAKKYYADKEKKAEEMERQMQEGSVTVGPDGKPMPMETDEEPADEEEPEEEKQPAPFQRKTWTPSFDELDALREWRAFALRCFNKGKSHAERFNRVEAALPAEVIDQIVTALASATTDEAIKAAFVIEETITPAPEYKSEVTADPSILALAASLNNLAEAYKENK